MTGPTNPIRRMAYDVDGTKVFHVSPANLITELTPETIAILNDETTRTGTNVSLSRRENLTVAFPEKRDLTGFFWATVTYIEQIQISSDTTTLLDGTWKTVMSPSSNQSSDEVYPRYTYDIHHVDEKAIRAIRFMREGAGVSTAHNMRAIHLYGTTSPGQDLDNLSIWMPAENKRVPPGYFDWGNTPRGSSGTRQFRVRNNSASRIAQDVVVTKSALGGAENTAIVAQHKFDFVGQSTVDTVDLGDLAPGATSDIITLSYNLAEDTILGPKTMRVHATPADWG